MINRIISKSIVEKMSCRKKIDAKIWNEWSEYTQLMESEVRSLRQDYNRSQESLRAATRRCHDLAKELNSRISQHEKERVLRDDQLSRILRALLVLESRLKQEQKSIRQLLCEKDGLIRTQQLEIARLRRLTKCYIKEARDQTCGCVNIDEIKDMDIDSSDFQLHELSSSSLSKDINHLKCEIITQLSESLDEQQQQQQEQQQQSSSANIRKTHSFAGSDISKASSLTSSENTDTSIITTTTDGSPSLLSTEGFCEGESTDDVSPHSTLNKSSSSSSVSSRCTPTIVTTDSDNEVTMVILGSNGSSSSSSDKPKCIVRSESKDDGMDCNYASDEDEGDDEDEPLYENCDKAKSVVVTRTQHRVNTDDSSNNNVQLQPTRIEASSPHSNDCESSGNWYSDPDEDKINDELIRHSVYRPNSKHNSVLECVNQILLRDMEDDENVLSVPRRFKHRGKIVRFQPARLSDIESVGSEMERRNSEDTPSSLPTAPPPPPPMTITTTTQDVSSDKNIKDEDNDNETDPSNGSFEATNSEDEYGMRIIPMHALNPESGIEEDVDDTKARPIVIIEPVSDKKSIISRSSKNNSVPVTVADDNLSIKSLALSSNHDYEEIESLPDIIAPMQISVKSAKAPSLPPKPQFHSNTLILKKIPSPSFLIDETSAKKQQASERLNSVVLHPVRSLKFDNDSLLTSTSKKLAESSESAKPPTQQQRLNRPKSIEQIPAKVTSIVKHFEEFKIDNNDDCKKPVTSQIVLDNYDIQQNFEEFKLDDCDLSEEPELRDDSSSSDTYTTLSPTNNLVSSLSSDSHENNNAPLASSNGNYDSFLEATGLSNKSILTPSRMLSNHKSMLKPKDVKYKSKIKATAVMERHAPATLTRHWTGPFV
ncbi:uncharacterized protein LOC106650102 isoform X3 [Trichogramma pretiosum]|uniref:uncharacterized protein LOC106650102 isoform X3 n=1 Tax=Trichogramma pretiosum TaxID=7493 RepID=UPI0006C953C6|nr:uncharacterized protein LOC106650102 isoform X3 [Trichogramma pretiosum]XP_014223387.1 uncharacterized protein LOC106650102 isoform X3 [Trichogramma pretiosum]XP_014223388.1 uncharacterized protein LOC106650102 isoform X3 [Trichogramma pretiosum]